MAVFQSDSRSFTARFHGSVDAETIRWIRRKLSLQTTVILRSPSEELRVGSDEERGEPRCHHIKTVFLHPYRAALNPMERLWHHFKSQGMASFLTGDGDVLTERVSQSIRELPDRPELIRSLYQQLHLAFSINTYLLFARIPNRKNVPREFERRCSPSKTDCMSQYFAK